MKTKGLKNFILVVILVTFAFSSTNELMAQESNKKIEGVWMGVLKTQGVQLRLVFNISKDGENGLKSTLDSPDQGAKGIPLAKTNWDGKKLNIDAPNMAASYAGEMVNDSTINGTWTQGGASFIVNVLKQKKRLALNRPQEPKPPFQYTTEDVTVTNKKFGFDLAGTLTLPKGKGPFPAVVLITGSGQQNRDEEIFGHKSFLLIADYLTKRGFAVLRCDDRGVFKSKGSLVDATSYDFSTDALAQVDFLKGDKRIDSKKIGLIGHSEGGLIAMMIASENNDIAFIISLAGPGVNGEDILLEQSLKISKLMGISEEVIKGNEEISKIMYSELKGESDNQKAQQNITESLRAYLAKSGEKNIDETIKSIQSSLSIKAYSWMRFFLLSEPSKYLEKVKCPVLALNGSKDVQVIATSNLPAIEKSVKKGGNNDVTVVEVKDVNHLFQHCTTGLPSEYEKVEETFSEDALKTLGDWLSKRFL